MNKKLILEIKEKLKREKEKIEENLKGFAKEDEKLAGDWDTKYPRFNGGVGSEGLEEEADEVEEYVTLLPIEANLETRLKEINLALEKIKKSKYGKCEKCGKTISEDRLKAYPQARTCQRCKI